MDTVLSREEIIDFCSSLVAPYKIKNGKLFDLDSYNEGDIGPFNKKDKQRLLERFEKGVLYLEYLQSLLYANSDHAILVVLQAMDAAGKDGIIKHVMSGVNPQGCNVTSFKVPTSTEHRHDFLWRCVKEIPERGMIGIFNRSYYEEVISVRVHPEWLAAEGFKSGEIHDQFWEHRFESINDLEKHLTRNNVHLIKIFLNVSKEEQRKRLLDRLDNHDKNWKFSPSDVEERRSWKKYRHAFNEMIQKTSTEHSPWNVVPADKKWYSRIIVLCAIIEKLASLESHFPTVSEDTLKTFEKMRSELQ